VRETAIVELPGIVRTLQKPAIDALMTVHCDLDELVSLRMLATSALSSIGIATTNDSDVREQSGPKPRPLPDAAADAFGSSRDPEKWDEPKLPEWDDKGPPLLPPGHRREDMDPTQSKSKKHKAAAWTPLVSV
jgi:hypothetical protein